MFQEEDEAPTILLLGNKLDMVTSGDHPRVVKQVDGEALARVSSAHGIVLGRINFCNYSKIPVYRSCPPTPVEIYPWYARILPFPQGAR